MFDCAHVIYVEAHCRVVDLKILNPFALGYLLERSCFTSAKYLVRMTVLLDPGPAEVCDIHFP